MRRTGSNRSVPSERFRELQDEFFATSKRLQLAQKREEKLALLNELQRIVQESIRALVDTDPKKMLTLGIIAASQLAVKSC
jgi:hypothetical protein